MIGSWIVESEVYGYFRGSILLYIAKSLGIGLARKGSISISIMKH